MAALIRVFGDIDLAEDAVQEAFAVALGRWPRDGVPPNPGGWITTTARNHAIDRLRRESRGRELLSEVAVLSPGSDDPGMPQEVGPVPDDRLRLIFTCCHPALSTQAQMALTLRLLGGLSTRQVAQRLPGDRGDDGATSGARQAQDQGGADPLPRARGPRAARPPPPGAGRRLPGLQRRAERLSRSGPLRRGDPAGADPGGADARRAGGGRPAGAAAADRVPPRLANRGRRFPGAARRAGPHPMGPGPDP